MDQTSIYNTIRQTVQSHLPGSRVLLFGSRVRGDFDRFSDYDLLVISPTTLSPRENIEWSTRLNHAIVKAIHAPIDLLLSSEDEVRTKQLLLGHIIRTAMREGIVL